MKVLKNLKIYIGGIMFLAVVAFCMSLKMQADHQTHHDKIFKDYLFYDTSIHAFKEMGPISEKIQKKIEEYQSEMRSLEFEMQKHKNEIRSKQEFLAYVIFFFLLLGTILAFTLQIKLNPKSSQSILLHKSK